MPAEGMASENNPRPVDPLLFSIYAEGYPIADALTASSGEGGSSAHEEGIEFVPVKKFGIEQITDPSTSDSHEEGIEFVPTSGSWYTTFSSGSGAHYSPSSHMVRSCIDPIGKLSDSSDENQRQTEMLDSPAWVFGVRDDARRMSGLIGKESRSSCSSSTDGFSTSNSEMHAIVPSWGTSSSVPSSGCSTVQTGTRQRFSKHKKGGKKSLGERHHKALSTGVSSSSSSSYSKNLSSLGVWQTSTVSEFYSSSVSSELHEKNISLLDEKRDESPEEIDSRMDKRIAEEIDGKPSYNSTQSSPARLGGRFRFLKKRSSGSTSSSRGNQKLVAEVEQKRKQYLGKKNDPSLPEKGLIENSIKRTQSSPEKRRHANIDTHNPLNKYEESLREIRMDEHPAIVRPPGVLKNFVAKKSLEAHTLIRSSSTSTPPYKRDYELDETIENDATVANTGTKGHVRGSSTKHLTINSKSKSTPTDQRQRIPKKSKKYLEAVGEGNEGHRKKRITNCTKGAFAIETDIEVQRMPSERKKQFGFDSRDDLHGSPVPRPLSQDGSGRHPISTEETATQVDLNETHDHVSTEWETLAEGGPEQQTVDLTTGPKDKTMKAELQPLNEPAETDKEKHTELEKSKSKASSEDSSRKAEHIKNSEITNGISLEDEASKAKRRSWWRLTPNIRRKMSNDISLETPTSFHGESHYSKDHDTQSIQGGDCSSTEAPNSLNTEQYSFKHIPTETGPQSDINLSEEDPIEENGIPTRGISPGTDNSNELKATGVEPSVLHLKKWNSTELKVTGLEPPASHFEKNRGQEKESEPDVQIGKVPSDVKGKESEEVKIEMTLATTEVGPNYIDVLQQPLDFYDQCLSVPSGIEATLSDTKFCSFFLEVESDSKANSHPDEVPSGIEATLSDTEFCGLGMGFESDSKMVNSHGDKVPIGIEAALRDTKSDSKENSHPDEVPSGIEATLSDTEFCGLGMGFESDSKTVNSHSDKVPIGIEAALRETKFCSLGTEFESDSKPVNSHNDEALFMSFEQPLDCSNNCCFAYGKPPLSVEGATGLGSMESRSEIGGLTEEIVNPAKVEAPGHLEKKYIDSNSSVESKSDSSKISNTKKCCIAEEPGIEVEKRGGWLYALKYNTPDHLDKKYNDSHSSVKSKGDNSKMPKTKKISIAEEMEIEVEKKGGWLFARKSKMPEQDIGASKKMPNPATLETPEEAEKRNHDDSGSKESVGDTLLNGTVVSDNTKGICVSEEVEIEVEKRGEWLFAHKSKKMDKECFDSSVQMFNTSTTKPEAPGQEKKTYADSNTKDSAGDASTNQSKVSDTTKGISVSEEVEIEVEKRGGWLFAHKSKRRENVDTAKKNRQEPSKYGKSNRGENIGESAGKSDQSKVSADSTRGISVSEEVEIEVEKRGGWLFAHKSKRKKKIVDSAERNRQQPKKLPITGASSSQSGDKSDHSKASGGDAAIDSAAESESTSDRSKRSSTSDRSKRSDTTRTTTAKDSAIEIEKRDGWLRTSLSRNTGPVGTKSVMDCNSIPAPGESGEEKLDRAGGRIQVDTKSGARRERDFTNSTGNTEQTDSSEKKPVNSGDSQSKDADKEEESTQSKPNNWKASAAAMRSLVTDETEDEDDDLNNPKDQNVSEYARDIIKEETATEYASHGDPQSKDRDQETESLASKPMLSETMRSIVAEETSLEMQKQSVRASKKTNQSVSCPVSKGTANVLTDNPKKHSYSLQSNGEELDSLHGAFEKSGLRKAQQHYKTSDTTRGGIAAELPIEIESRGGWLLSRKHRRKSNQTPATKNVTGKRIRRPMLKVSEIARGNTADEEEIEIDESKGWFRIRRNRRKKLLEPDGKSCVVSPKGKACGGYAPAGLSPRNFTAIVPLHDGNETNTNVIHRCNNRQDAPTKQKYSDLRDDEISRTNSMVESVSGKDVSRRMLLEEDEFDVSCKAFGKDTAFDIRNLVRSKQDNMTKQIVSELRHYEASCKDVGRSMLLENEKFDVSCKAFGKDTALDIRNLIGNKQNNMTKQIVSDLRDYEASCKDIGSSMLMANEESCKAFGKDAACDIHELVGSRQDDHSSGYSRPEKKKNSMIESVNSNDVAKMRKDDEFDVSCKAFGKDTALDIRNLVVGPSQDDMTRQIISDLQSDQTKSSMQSEQTKNSMIESVSAKDIVKMVEKDEFDVSCKAFGKDTAFDIRNLVIGPSQGDMTQQIISDLQSEENSMVVSATSKDISRRSLLEDDEFDISCKAFGNDTALNLRNLMVRSNPDAATKQIIGDLQSQEKSMVKSGSSKVLVRKSFDVSCKSAEKGTFYVCR